MKGLGHKSISFFIALVLGFAATVWQGQQWTPRDESNEMESPNSVVPPAPVATNATACATNSDVGVQEENLEVFTDESRIGRARKNKVEIRCSSRQEGTHTEIRFYSRAAGKEWVQKQLFEFEKLDGLPCDPIVKDFNDDGVKDLTYQSGEAARGSNDIRKLFIYDKTRD